MKIGRFLLVILAASFLALAAGAANTAAPIVKISSGQVRGSYSGKLMVFKGIPFAQPPVGNLRWRPPQAVKPWKGVRNATYFGHDCMQVQSPRDAAPVRTKPSEDCLYLNVWAPRNHGSTPLPVMVWIYGGGFTTGGTSPAPYDGSHFAQKGVVFVSFNYRLGRFGFFAFPALLKEPGPYGNYAFMDQIAALKWVRSNISAFGGNPNDVTIFGESAGGMSVVQLLSSPMAQGLFKRAMIESGGGRGSLLNPRPLDHSGPNGEVSATQTGVNFAKSVGIHGTGAAALAALRRLPADKVVMAGFGAPRGRRGSRGRGRGRGSASAGARDRGPAPAPTYSGLILDGKVITEPAEQVFKEGKEYPVPVLIGTNSADLGFSRAQTMAALFAPFGKNAAAARAAFDVKPGDKVAQIGREVAAVQLMLEPARFIARSVAKIGQPIYVYRFSYVAAPLRKRLSGAPHSSEIPYVFDTIRESTWGNHGTGLTPEGLKTAWQMNDYWVNFAKTGNPNGPGLPTWPKFTAAGDKLLNFTMNGPKGMVDPWAARLNVVEKIQK